MKVIMSNLTNKNQLTKNNSQNKQLTFGAINFEDLSPLVKALKEMGKNDNELLTAVSSKEPKGYLRGFFDALDSKELSKKAKQINIDGNDVNIKIEPNGFAFDYAGTSPGFEITAINSKNPAEKNSIKHEIRRWNEPSEAANKFFEAIETVTNSIANTPEYIERKTAEIAKNWGKNTK